MKKSFQTTLIMLGCLVLLLGWYVGYEKKFRPQHELAEEKAKDLITLDRASVSEITLDRAKNALTDEKGKTAAAPSETETIELRKNGLDWSIVKPVQYPADNTQIESIVTTGVSTKWERVVDEHPKDLDEYGLKTPLIKASFRKDASSPAQTILVGRDTPTGSSVYVKIDGKDPVYRASRIVRTSFEKPLKDLRDKTILTVPVTQIAEVEVQLPKESLVVKRDDKGVWSLLREGLPADPGEWTKTLNALLDAKAKDFVDSKDLKKYGLQPPAVKVQITKTDKSKVAIRIGKAADKTYAKLDTKDMVFEIDKDVLTKLQQPGSTYVDRHVAQFNRFDATHVRLTRHNDVTDLMKDAKKSEWTLSDEASLPPDKRTTIEKGKMDTFLTSLQDMKADKYLKGQSTVEDPALKLEIWEAGSKPEEPKVVLSFRPEGKNVIGSRNGVDVPFSISGAEYKKIDVGKKDLTKEKKPVPEIKKSAAQTPDKGKG